MHSSRHVCSLAVCMSGWMLECDACACAPSSSCPYAQFELPSGSSGASVPKPRSQEPKPRSINEAAPFTKSGHGVNVLVSHVEQTWNEGIGILLFNFFSFLFHLGNCMQLSVRVCSLSPIKKNTRLNWYKWARMKHKFNIVIKVYNRLKCLPTNHMAQRTDHLRWSEDLEFRRHQAIWEAVWLEIWEVVTEHGFVSEGKLSDRVLRVRCFSVQY